MRRSFSFQYSSNPPLRSGFQAIALIAAVTFATPSHADTITFGSGANSFSIEFVTIGNPGNTADNTGDPNPAGRVDYTYGIGKFEVNEDMIDKYNAAFGTANLLVIGKDVRAPNKPATSVSWNEAARFVNWLNTSTGGYAAYKFSTSGVGDDINVWTASDTSDYDALNPYRSKRATYVLPSYNEWYKAAYYNAANDTYYDFATGSDTAPTPIASGTTAGTAVYLQTINQGPADVNQAGGLSPFGVMELGAHVYEWEQSSFDLLNTSGSSDRGQRGGGWSDLNYDLMSSTGVDGMTIIEGNEWVFVWQK